MKNCDEIIASIILNDKNRTNLALYGFRSWMLQDINYPYEVILNLFNNKEKIYKNMSVGANIYCNSIIKEYKPPKIFNISAANNLGIYFAKGKYVIFANSDVIFPSDYLGRVIAELSLRNICYAISSRVNLNKMQTEKLLPPDKYTRDNNFNFLKGFENILGRTIDYLGSWISLREITFAIGGMDPNILCHEDSEYNDRIMHYLRKNKKQDCL